MLGRLDLKRHLLIGAAFLRLKIIKSFCACNPFFTGACFRLTLASLSLPLRWVRCFWAEWRAGMRTRGKCADAS
nr:MAG TPA: hypothetical protein [Caudoviricetes sp.]